jgi:hypothetical protein
MAIADLGGDCNSHRRRTYLAQGATKKIPGRDAARRRPPTLKGPAARPLPANLLLKAQLFDVAPELAQWVKTFARARAGIAHEIIESLLAGDDDEMRDAALKRMRMMTGLPREI